MGGARKKVGTHLIIARIMIRTIDGWIDGYVWMDG